jgi:transposase
VYLRQLLVHGARAVLGHTLRKPERAGSWLSRLALRRNTNVAAIAQANKMARVIWAMLTRNEGFRSVFAAASGGNIGPA